MGLHGHGVDQPIVHSHPDRSGIGADLSQETVVMTASPAQPTTSAVERKTGDQDQVQLMGGNHLPGIDGLAHPELMHLVWDRGVSKGQRVAGAQSRQDPSPAWEGDEQRSHVDLVWHRQIGGHGSRETTGQPTPEMGHDLLSHRGLDPTGSAHP